MLSSCKLFSVAALLLLFSAVFCLGADTRQDLLHNQEATQSDSCPDNGGSVPDCFCCCSHFVPGGYAPAIVMAPLPFFPLLQQEFLIFVSPEPLFRPPRA
jgi:hypothetical protein